MYHYNFTNDLRISNLDSILREAATAFLTDTVPSAADDKSKNNNFMTVGFYFNLKAKGNCAKLASKGNIKKVVLNFIKKFQFPNPRTNSDYENAIADKILLAPMRDIVKLLHIFSLIDKNIAYLTKDEIKNFIFYNDELAKRTNYNLLNTANQIIEYRKNSTLPTCIDTNENNHIWNQPERQIREMIKTLNYTGCFIEDENGIRLKTSDINRDNEADLFEIINCNSYWNGESLEDYQNYMDHDLEINEYDNGYEDELTRIYNLENNKDFAIEAFNFLKKKQLLNNTVITKLTNIDFCKEELKCSFSVLIKLPENCSEEKIRELSFIQGRSRYYPDSLKFANTSFITTNDWYNGTGTSNHRNNRLTYINYIRSLLEGENQMAVKIDRSHNRIIFGAPGTGKSNRLNNETSLFEYKQNFTDEKEKFLYHYSQIDANDNYVPQCVAIGYLNSNYLKNKSSEEIKIELKKFNPQNNSGYYIRTGSQVSEFYNGEQDYEYDKAQELFLNDYKNIDPNKNKVPQCHALGMKYSNYILDAYKNTSPRIAINKLIGKNEEDAEGYYIITGAQSFKFINDFKKMEISASNNTKLVERVTFHPNYSYAQFVGTYKPVQDNNDENQIKYEYVPGPFMRVYVNTKKDSEHNYLLLIEEINRANVAAVFGDVFQLLDRYGEKGDKNGKHPFESEYPIIASEDVKKYLKNRGIFEDDIRIPSNMYIWATMNSADQGVLPMDAAFKRRWDFEYISIDENENWNYIIPLPNNESIKWNVLRKAINNKLKKIAGVNEDKLLGPYFISKSKLDSIQGELTKEQKDKFIETFKSKVLMYLYEDVCKMRPTALFDVTLEDGQTKPHYSDICKAFDENGIGIFGFKKDDIEAKYKCPSSGVVSEQE